MKKYQTPETEAIVWAVCAHVVKPLWLTIRTAANSQRSGLWATRPKGGDTCQSDPWDPSILRLPSATRFGLINELGSRRVAIAVSVCVFTPHQISTPPAQVSHWGLPAETTIPHQYLKRFLIKPRLHPGSSQSGETEGVSGDPLSLHLPIDFPSTRKQWRQQIAGGHRGGGVWDGHVGVKHSSSNGGLNIYGLLEPVCAMLPCRRMTQSWFPFPCLFAFPKGFFGELHRTSWCLSLGRCMEETCGTMQGSNAFRWCLFRCLWLRGSLKSPFHLRK